jgi:hypothetical protein
MNNEAMYCPKDKQIPKETGWLPKCSHQFHIYNSCLGRKNDKPDYTYCPCHHHRFKIRDDSTIHLIDEINNCDNCNKRLICPRINEIFI